MLQGFISRCYFFPLKTYSRGRKPVPVWIVYKQVCGCLFVMQELLPIYLDVLHYLKKADGNTGFSFLQGSVGWDQVFQIEKEKFLVYVVCRHLLN